jgi:3-oxoacyl-[acyl-carrier-protein] synthase II
MDLYIHGTGVISAAGYNSSPDFLSGPPEQGKRSLLCTEPDHTAYIPPMQLRRMSKAVRMGIGASRIALSEAGLEKPDAISIGTALGCLQDTEVFLSKMADQDEQMLTPTAFIQSTHNTVSGQIALLAGCNGHNLTFVHRGHSFEHALMDARLYLNDHPGAFVLTGGIDELTDSSLAVYKRVGVYRRDDWGPDDIMYEAPGSIGGEGAGFFAVSDKPGQRGSLKISSMDLFIARDCETAHRQIASVLASGSMSPKDVDLVVLGNNGDSRYQPFYDRLKTETFVNTPQMSFKHVTGEYATAIAAGIGMLSSTLARGIPGFMLQNGKPGKIRQIVFVNNFMHHYSCLKLEVV